MMGHQVPPQDPLFSVNVQLETRVRANHPLRAVKNLIDFDFIYTSRWLIPMVQTATSRFLLPSS